MLLLILVNEAAGAIASFDLVDLGWGAAGWRQPRIGNRSRTESASRRRPTDSRTWAEGFPPLASTRTPRRRRSVTEPGSPRAIPHHDLHQSAVTALLSGAFT